MRRHVCMCVGDRVGVCACVGVCMCVGGGVDGTGSSRFGYNISLHDCVIGAREHVCTFFF